jgi:glutamate dehydrogenase (NAD(P)+)
MDEYTLIAGKPQPGVITGKPVQLGGSIGRNDATARGGMYCIREAARILGIDLAKATVAVQGYGNAGYYAAELCSTLFGSKILAVCDSKGGAFNKEGIEPSLVPANKFWASKLEQFSKCKSFVHQSC